MINDKLFIHADGSRVSIAIIRLCVCDSVGDSVILSVCTIKLKRLKIAKLGTETVNHDSLPDNEY